MPDARGPARGRPGLPNLTRRPEPRCVNIGFPNDHPPGTPTEVEFSMIPSDCSSLRGRLGPAGLRLLVVDDNRDAADSLAMLLGLWGHQARVAYDGPAALRAAEAEPPDAVLLDLALPGRSGYHLAEDLRPAALIAVTGYADEGLREQARAAGFDHFFVKPVDLEALRGLLGEFQGVQRLSVHTR